jgi:hypothetical protein
MSAALGLGVSPSFSRAMGVLPAHVSGLVAWYDARVGVTTVDATVLDPNDIRTGNWTRTGCTAPAADTMLDSNDGAPAFHFFDQLPGVQTDHAFQIVLDAKAGVRVTQITVELGTASMQATLATGVVNAVNNCVASALDVGGGWFRYTITGTSTAGVLLRIFSMFGGSALYQGDGTGTMLVRGITVAQRNVSAWADQSGAGHNATQAVAASRPLLESAGLGGQPSVWGDGIDDFLKTAGFTLVQPTTIVVATQAVAHAANASPWDGFTVNTLRLIDTGADWQMNAGASGPSVARDLNPHILSATYSGAASVLRIDGTPTAASNAGAAGAGGLTLLADGANANPAKSRIGAACVYNRALGAAELGIVERYLGSVFGIAIA